MELKKYNFNGTQATTFILLIFIAIVISQYVFVYMDVAYGILICLIITLLIYIMISVVGMDRKFIKSAESLALIPVYVLFTSSLPWFFINQNLLLPAVYSTILALCFWHMHEHDIKPSSIGFVTDKLFKYIILGAIIGFMTGWVEYWVLKIPPAFPAFEVKYLVRDLFYMTFFVGLGEELLFRGLIQRDLIEAYGVNKGILGQAFLFGIMHMTWRSPLEVLFTFVAGLMFGILYHKTGSLTAPIVFHGVNNTMLVSVLPYLFNGMLF